MRGAACNGIDHAGESPVAAFARFGCVAVPDTRVGRPARVQAQVKVLGAGRLVRPVRGASESWGRSESEHYSVEMASHRNRAGGFEQPSPFPQGRRPMGVDEGNGPMQSASAPAYGWWHHENGR